MKRQSESRLFNWIDDLIFFFQTKKITKGSREEGSEGKEREREGRRGVVRNIIKTLPLNLDSNKETRTGMY